MEDGHIFDASLKDAEIFSQFSGGQRLETAKRIEAPKLERGLRSNHASFLKIIWGAVVFLEVAYFWGLNLFCYNSKWSPTSLGENPAGFPNQVPRARVLESD